MSNIPTITIFQNLDKEIDVFIKFLNHPNFPQNRSMILKIYPKLAEMIDKQNEKVAVKEFIKEFYQKHKDAINKIVSDSEKTLSDSQEALEQLGNLMEYKWPKNTYYKAYPTILPFSPFRENEFFFSILNPLLKNEGIDVLYIAIHEISHFIFLDQLVRIEGKNNIKFNKDLVYYFKESLTTVVLNQKELKLFLGKDKILGNQNIRDIYIKKDEKVMSLIDYLFKKFEAKQSFNDFLEQTLLILNKSKSGFVEKKELWDKNGSKIFKVGDLIVEYKKPIVI